MSRTILTLQDRFRGCLLGLAIGDAIGGRFEAQSAEFIRQRFANWRSLIDGVDGELWYTDDTQMTIGVAETLVECGTIDEARLCKAFVSNYVPSRGYGRGTRAVIEAMENGRDHVAVAEKYFPGGSLGNGAAMRVAPIGLVFGADHDRLWEQARLSALPTHRSALAIEGAQLLALAVGYCSSVDRFDRAELLSLLSARCNSIEYRKRIGAAASVSSEDLATLGNGIEALESVPTAIASFALHADSYEQAIGQTILLGGDTDTIAAMTGALSGAYLGVEAIAPSMIASLESTPKGGDYLLELADQLAAIAKL
jgi:poly(ADP-ribose) glycohydrolase ARH3